jgi:hypothetical protein
MTSLSPRSTLLKRCRAGLCLGGLALVYTGCALVGYGTNDGLDSGHIADPLEAGLDAVVPGEAGSDAGTPDAQTVLDAGADAQPSVRDAGPDGQPDADVDAATVGDADVPDAAQENPTPDAGNGGGCGADETCSPTCAVGVCDVDCVGSARCDGRCSSLTICDLDCTDGQKCGFSCASRATCTLGCSGSDNCATTCASQATCNIDCSHSAKCDAKCESGSLCNVDCHSATDCKGITCDSGASCRVNCQVGGDPAGKCELACQDGTGASCPDGSLVCNRPC